jgi:hypothetical protein
MTADFIDSVRDEMQTPLSRLGSSKSIYADTEGQMEDDTVVATALANEEAAADVFDDWASTGGPLGEAFGDAADVAREHAEELDGRTDAEADPSVIYDHLAGVEGSVARLGAFVGRSLVEEKKTGQRTGYFTGQADPQTARVFREFGNDLDTQLEQAVDLLEGQCESDDDWTVAEDAAVDVIEAAYDEYVETLESMGVNPKDVC